MSIQQDLKEINLQHQLSIVDTNELSLEPPKLKYQNTILSSLSEDEDQPKIMEKNQKQIHARDIDIMEHNDQVVQNVQQICLLHQKPLQIICVTDRCRVCTSCAIFGQHKNHLFKSQEDIKRDKLNYIKQINQVITDKNILDYQIQHSKYFAILKNKQNQLLQKVEDKISQLVHQLKQIQTILKQRIEKIVSEIQQKEQKVIDQNHKNFCNQFDSWAKNSQKYIQKLSSQDIIINLQILNYGSEQKPHCQIGKKLIQKFKIQTQVSNSSLKQQSQLIRIDIDHTINKRIQQCILVTKGYMLELPPLPPLHNYISNGEQKLIDDEPPKIFQSPLDSSDKNYSQKVHETSFYSNNNFKSSDSFSGSKTHNELPDISFISDRKKQKSTMRPLSETRVLKTPTKKLKNKINLEPKFQKIYDNLIADKLDILDLTGAQLGDSVCLQIVKHLPGSKCRSVKLIRNKISDKGFSALLGYFQNVITLNMSQNLLTDESLNQIIGNLRVLPNMKSLILSLNKINFRSVKDRTDIIREQGIVLSM